VRLNVFVSIPGLSETAPAALEFYHERVLVDAPVDEFVYLALFLFAADLFD
jgi:hypothetical protein